MPRRATIVPHLTQEQLKTRYERCRNAIEQRRLQFVLFVASGRTIKEAAHLVDYEYEHARDILKLYNAGGPEALKPRKPGPKVGSGPAVNARLSLEQREQLKAALAGPAPGGGVWTGPKVAVWITQVTGKNTSPQRAWVWLKRLGYSKLQPRPRHQQASQEEQDRFKKN